MIQRRKLPDERPGITRKVVIGGRNLYLTTGDFETGELGEVFIKCGKSGKQNSVYDIIALSISLGLQYGIPLEVYIDKLKYQKMESGGVTTDPQIPMCDSVIDYIARRLEMDYLNERTPNDNDQGSETTQTARGGC